MASKGIEELITTFYVRNSNVVEKIINDIKQEENELHKPFGRVAYSKELTSH